MVSVVSTFCRNQPGAIIVIPWCNIQVNTRGLRTFNILFPGQPRNFRYRRAILSVLRALHILCTGVLIGGHIFNQSPEVIEPWLYASVLSGLAIFATDLHASMAVLFELRGLLLLLKIALLLLIPLFWQLRIPLLITVLFIGAVGSHMPKHWRHKVLLFEKRIIPDERSG